MEAYKFKFGLLLPLTISAEHVQSLFSPNNIISISTNNKVPSSKSNSTLFITSNTIKLNQGSFNITNVFNVSYDDPIQKPIDGFSHVNKQELKFNKKITTKPCGLNSNNRLVPLRSRIDPLQESKNKSRT